MDRARDDVAVMKDNRDETLIRSDMRAQNVIVLTAGRVTPLASSMLDSLIREILRLGKSPIVVLGPDGDELLRASREIEKSEIVFDPNFAGEIFSSIHAGLHAAKSASLIIALGESLLPTTAWTELNEIYARDWWTTKSVQVLRDSRHRWPQLITAHGAQTLIKLPSQTIWQSDAISAELIEMPSDPVLEVCFPL